MGELTEAGDQSRRRLGIAEISVSEAAFLARVPRCSGQTLAQWIKEAMSAPGLSIQPLLPQIAIEAAPYPRRFTADPADRLIVATARVANATLMTRDRLRFRRHLTAVAAPRPALLRSYAHTQR